MSNMKKILKENMVKWVIPFCLFAFLPLSASAQKFALLDMDYILKRIHAKDHPELADRLPELISQTIDADMAYMHEHHVIDEEGNVDLENR